MAPIRVLLVDDNSSFLNLEAQLLAAQPEIVIVGYAHSGHEALTQVERLQPDIVLLDWLMPGMGGLETTLHLKARLNPPLIFIVTQHDQPDLRAAAKRAGADAFINKALLNQELLPLLAVFALDDEALN